MGLQSKKVNEAIRRYKGDSAFSLPTKARSNISGLQASKIVLTRAQLPWYLNLGCVKCRNCDNACLLFKLFALWYSIWQLVHNETDLMPFTSCEFPTTCLS